VVPKMMEMVVAKWMLERTVKRSIMKTTQNAMEFEMKRVMKRT
jgi:hypothetical protein